MGKFTGSCPQARVEGWGERSGLQRATIDSLFHLVQVDWGERSEPQHKPGRTDVSDAHVGVRSSPQPTCSACFSLAVSAALR